MSQQDKIFNPYPSLDPALNLKSTLGLPVYEGAQNISSFKQSASTANSSNITWNYTPIPGTIVSPVVLCRIKPVVTVQAGLALLATENVLEFGKSTCFSDYPVMEMINSSTVTIDTAQVDDETAQIWPLRKNLLSEEEENLYMKMQPVARDYLLNYTDYTGLEQVSPFTGFGGEKDYSRGSYIGDSSQVLNVTANPVGDATTAKNGTFTVSMTSPLLVSPFGMSPNSSGFDIRNKLTVSLNLKQLSQMSFLKSSLASGLTVTSLTLQPSDCELIFFVYTPSIGRPLPAKSSHSYKKYTRTQLNINLPAVGTPVNVTSPSVNLGTVPTRAIIAGRRVVNEVNCNIPHSYLPLSNVSVNFDGQSNLLSNCSQSQYFAMSVESGMRHTDYQKFSGSVLTGPPAGTNAAADLQTFTKPTVCSPVYLTFGKHIQTRSFASPNTIQNVNCYVSANVSNQNVPAGGYEFTVVYENDAIIVSENGVSINFSTGLLTNDDVLASMKQEPVNWLSNLPMTGGMNWMDKSMRKVKDNSKKEMLYKQIEDLKDKVERLEMSGNGRASGRASGSELNNALLNKLKQHNK